ncbi:hypothetical protein V5O48_013350 [Marasmius crinis-equi]|uniref:Cytochrome P450 n=1 Tax=Marasmius crinis-equi TaxID=585013 RepID=A0ABR3F0P4_9AGAR
MSLFLAAACFLGVSLWFASRSFGKPPLPPGPPADPLIGHLRIIPSQKTSETFQEWSKTYGDVIHLRVLGRKIVVLGSLEAAQALLENRGANYSCRPKFTVYELMGWSPSMMLLQYGKRLLKHRKMLQQYFGAKESLSFNHIFAEEAQLLVKNLSNAAPRTHHHYVHRYTVSNVMRAAFGHQVRSDDDEFLKLANDIGVTMNASGPPGNTPVDFFPWLRYMPAWFPGTHYASVARSYSKTVRRLYDFPLDFVRARMKNENYERCFASQKLEELDDSADPEELDDIKGAAAAIFSGGEDTTYASLQDFYLAMVLYPECQKRAYKEIVSVTGQNALPDSNDRELLPYVECIVQEVLRWNVVAALGAPHRAINDDVYKGMFIPKGAMVIANIRGMSRDENMYSNPTAFDPNRFLPEPQGKGEPYFTAAFGFGRRICPGRHFASLALWHAIACTLATLEIIPVKDEMGDPKLPEVAFAEGLVSEPLPFEYDVRLRSEAAKRLIAAQI